MSFTISIPDNTYNSSSSEQKYIKFIVPDSIYNKSVFLDDNEYIKFKYNTHYYMIDKYQLIYSGSRHIIYGHYNHKTKELLVED